MYIHAITQHLLNLYVEVVTIFNGTFWNILDCLFAITMFYAHIYKGLVTAEVGIQTSYRYKYVAKANVCVRVSLYF